MPACLYLHQPLSTAGTTYYHERSVVRIGTPLVTALGGSAARHALGHATCLHTMEPLTAAAAASTKGEESAECVNINLGSSQMDEWHCEKSAKLVTCGRCGLPQVRITSFPLA